MARTTPGPGGPGKGKRGKKAAVAFNNPFRFKGGTPPITPVIPKVPIVAADGTYTKYNTGTKITTKYNADGTRFRKANPSGRRIVPAGAGGRGFRVRQAK